MLNFHSFLINTEKFVRFVYVRKLHMCSDVRQIRKPNLPAKNLKRDSISFKQIMDDQNDDEVKLPDDTQRILDQFLEEKAKQDKEDLFSENWNLSQFW